MKCKNCGKYFNTHAFGETYCPYCGVQVDEKKKKKIQNIEYFENTYGLWILLAGLPILIMIIVGVANLLL